MDADERELGSWVRCLPQGEGLTQRVDQPDRDGQSTHRDLESVQIWE
jgi:hypothetical protein